MNKTMEQEQWIVSYMNKILLQDHNKCDYFTITRFELFDCFYFQCLIIQIFELRIL